MKNVLVIGSYNVGLVVVGPRIPSAGQTIMGHEFQMGPGGKGSNQAIAVKRLGGEVAFVARVGGDSFGRDALDMFRREGLDARFVAVDEKHHTGAGIIFVDSHGQNAIGVAPGANYQLSADDLEAAASLFAPGAILLIQLETPLDIVRQAVRRARQAGMTVILNPAPAPSRPLEEDILSCVDVITPNETEAHELTGIEVKDSASAQQAARKLQAAGAKSVVITLGSAGALLLDSNGPKVFAPYRVKVVDTTGAGDAFNGGLAYALSAGKSMEEAIDFANRVGALCVTKAGTIDGLPSLAEVMLLKRS